jgi:DNA-binding transcriptional ArsR family regulator
MKSKIGLQPRIAAVGELAHPERMRAFSALHRRPMTRLELQAELSDVASTTLFRHLNRLVDAGLVQVVGERRGGSNRERIYESLPFDLTSEEAGRLTGDDYVALVTALAGDLVAAVQRAARSVAGLAGRSTFGVQTFYATDVEHRRIVKRFDEFLAELDRDFGPAGKRTPRTLSYGMCPREV